MIIEEYERRGIALLPQPLLDYKADLYRAQDLKERERILADMRMMLGEEVSPLVQHAKWLFKPPANTLLTLPHMIPRLDVQLDAVNALK